MIGTALSEEQLTGIAELMRAIGHETRLRLIDALRVRGELSVGELEAETGISQPALSQQLAILRKAHLVRTRRAAKQIYYRIASETFDEVAQFLASLAGAPPLIARSATGQKKGRGSAAMFARML